MISQISTKNIFKIISASILIGYLIFQNYLQNPSPQNQEDQKVVETPKLQQNETLNTDQYSTNEKESEEKNSIEEIMKSEDYIVSETCKNTKRFSYNKCQCPDGYYDDFEKNECLKCPYPCLKCSSDSINFCESCSQEPYLTFDHLVPEEKIKELDDYLVNEVKIYQLEEEYLIDFNAVGKKHASAFFLAKREDWKTSYKFFEDRIYRLNEYFYKKNDNYYHKARKLSEFVEKLNIFEYTGAFTVIINDPYQQGVRHFDHSFKSIVSEFIWIRFNDLKQFYIEDKQKNKQFVRCYLGFFDDRRVHNIGTIDQYSYSIRVNGKFKPWVRQYILDNFQFDSPVIRNTFIKQEEILKPYPYLDKAFMDKNATIINEIEEKYKLNKLNEL